MGDGLAPAGSGLLESWYHRLWGKAWGDVVKYRKLLRALRRCQVFPNLLTLYSSLPILLFRTMLSFLQLFPRDLWRGLPYYEDIVACKRAVDRNRLVLECPLSLEWYFGERVRDWRVKPLVRRPIPQDLPRLTFRPQLMDMANQAIFIEGQGIAASTQQGDYLQYIRESLMPRTPVRRFDDEMGEYSDDHDSGFDPPLEDGDEDGDDDGDDEGYDEDPHLRPFARGRVDPDSVGETLEQFVPSQRGSRHDGASTGQTRDVSQVCD